MVLLEIRHASVLAAPTQGNIVFIHGACMGAWCWENNLLPYFASKGYDAYALSLRGHGESPSDGNYKTRRIRHYVEDATRFLATLSGTIYLVGHSMGGHVAQHILNQKIINIEKLVLIAAVPPHGVWRVTLKTAWHYPLLFANLNLTRRFLPLFKDVERAQRYFFGAHRDNYLTQYVLKNLKEESYFAYWDMLCLDLPKPKSSETPVLVLGGAEDFLFGIRDVTATATAYGVKPIFFEGMGHNLFMELGWEKVAICMDRFLIPQEGTA